MSVIMMKRKASPIQYIDTAMKLLEHTLKYTRKQFANKDYDVVRRLRDLSITILNETIEANSIYPKCELDVELRYKHLVEARGAVQAMCALLSAVQNVLQNTVTNFGWLEWGRLMDSEDELISKVIRADKRLKF